MAFISGSVKRTRKISAFALPFGSGGRPAFLAFGFGIPELLNDSRANREQRRSPNGTFQTLNLNLAVQIEYYDLFQKKTHWKMTEKYTWRLTYFAKGDGAFSWDSTPDKHDTEQEEAN
jgi:hypothetical protein